MLINHVCFRQICRNSDLFDMEEQNTTKHIEEKIHSSLSKEQIIARKESTKDKIFSRIEKRRNRHVLRYLTAACIACFVLLGGYWYISTSTNERQWKEIVTAKGIKETITLPDGTAVTLNGGSTFRYPEKFTGNARNVELEGEGYFDVITNKKAPFIVKTEKIDIRVLGTKFNLKAYQEDETIEAILEEGHIQMIGKDMDRTMDMKPGEYVLFDKQNKAFSKSHIDATKASWWKSGKFNFHSMLFADICKTLERNFGFTFIIQNEDIKNKVFSAEFEKGEKVKDILHILSISYPYQFDIQDKTITIK